MNSKPLNVVIGPFITRDKFTELTGLCRKTTDKFYNQNDIKEKYIDRIKWHGFPVDELDFSEEIVGKSALEVFRLLSMEQPNLAGIQATMSISTKKDYIFERGDKPKIDDLKIMFNKLGKAIALTKTANSKLEKQAFREFLKIEIELGKINKEKLSVVQKFAFEYLKYMINVRSVAAKFKKNGRSDDLIESSIESLTLIQKETRKLYSKKFLRALAEWNLAQVASLKKDEDIFISCLSGLIDFYGGDFCYIRDELESDEDTGLMMKKSAVKEFLKYKEDLLNERVA